MKVVVYTILVHYIVQAEIKKKAFINYLSTKKWRFLNISM